MYILSYAVLLSDQRDLSLTRRASLTVVSCSLCQLSFVALLANVRVVGFRRRPVRAIHVWTRRWTTGVGLRHRDIFPVAPRTKLTIGVGTHLLDVCDSVPNSGGVFSSRDELGFSGGLLSYGAASSDCTHQLGDGIVILKM